MARFSVCILLAASLCSLTGCQGGGADNEMTPAQAPAGADAQGVSGGAAAPGGAAPASSSAPAAGGQMQGAKTD